MRESGRDAARGVPQIHLRIFLFFVLLCSRCSSVRVCVYVLVCICVFVCGRPCLFCIWLIVHALTVCFVFARRRLPQSAPLPKPPFSSSRKTHKIEIRLPAHAGLFNVFALSVASSSPPPSHPRSLHRIDDGDGGPRFSSLLLSLTLTTTAQSPAPFPCSHPPFPPHPPGNQSHARGGYASSSTHVKQKIKAR